MTAHSRLILLAAAAAATSACATTSPGAAPSTPIIGYKLPRTVASASGTLTIERCSASDIELSGSFVVAAEGRPTGPEVSVTAADLASLRFRRQVEVQRHPNQTIASVNSVVEDRMPSIIGSIITSVANVAGAFLPGARADSSGCSDKVVAARARVDAIDRAVDRIRTDLSKGTGDPEAFIQRRDALLQEQAFLRQSRLTAAFSEDLPEAGSKDINIAASLRPFLRPGMTPLVTLHVVGPAAPAQPIDYTCPEQNALCLPAPLLPSAGWSVELRHRDQVLARGRVTAPMPQWAATTSLPLRVGFAGNRSFGATYDGFGRQTSAKWGSEASGATASQAIAGYTETGAGLVDTLRGRTELEREQAEIQELEVQQRLNRLRACRDILARGGSECPAEAQPSGAE